MLGNLFHIKINSSEDNKDNGFYALMTSGASIICLADEEYVVPKEAVDKLNNKKISYEVVTKNNFSKIIIEDRPDATKTKI